jgi:hypothetical protein
VLDEFQDQTYQGDDIEFTPETTTEIWDKFVKLFGDTGPHKLHEVLCYRIENGLGPGEGGSKV